MTTKSNVFTKPKKKKKTLLHVQSVGDKASSNKGYHVVLLSYKILIEEKC